MIKYWFKNRLVYDIIVPIVLVAIMIFAFIVPMFNNLAQANQMQSLYNNTKLNFDIPSPSYEQISQLESKEFIEGVFPYYFTKVSVKTSQKTRETNLFLSEAFDKLEQTMYCNARCIQKSKKEHTNPILVDYKFVQDTGAKLDETVSITFGSTKIDFQISAIYETNTNYTNGAVLVKWDGLQKQTITALSPNLTYSGAYVYATNTQQCKQYLQTEYKPYGRLKNPQDFATQEAYQTHYNAFMSANYSNEITDFSVKAQDVKSNVQSKQNTANLYAILVGVIMLVGLVASNFILWLRGSERKYFANRQIKGNKNTVVYYLVSTLTQAAIVIFGILISALVVPSTLTMYVPTAMAMSKTTILIISVAVVMMLVAVENMILSNTQKNKKTQKKSEKDNVLEETKL